MWHMREVQTYQQRTSSLAPQVGACSILLGLLSSSDEVTEVAMLMIGNCTSCDDVEVIRTWESVMVGGQVVDLYSHCKYCVEELEDE